MKSTYVSPKIEIEVVSKEDIMLYSDNYIYVEGLFPGNAE